MEPVGAATNLREGIQVGTVTSSLAAGPVRPANSNARIVDKDEFEHSVISVFRDTSAMRRFRGLTHSHCLSTGERPHVPRDPAAYASTEQGGWTVFQGFQTSA
ncbi:hypothetical protein RSAG8_00833, partial [Rhizoctonia solani AG-8 WAC10335]